MRKDRIAKLLHTTIYQFITTELPIQKIGAIITITDVQTVPSQGFAKIYLSFLSTKKNIDETLLLNQVLQEKKRLKKYLSHKLRNKLRTIPNLEFCIDNSTKNAIAIDQILTNLT